MPPFVLRLKKSTTLTGNKKLARVGPLRIKRRFSYRKGAQVGPAYGQVPLRKTGGGATRGIGFGSLIPNLTSSFGITSPRRRKRRLVRG